MSNVQEVKLLGAWLSPFVQRIKWALNMKGVEYEYLEQDLVNKDTLLIQCNPVHKKVPVLIHNDRPIAESLIILEYLDETWKNRPLLPQDLYQRAMARFWAKFVEDKLTETIRQVLFVDGENQEKEVKNAKDALETLEGELKGKRFFGGESVGFVDIVLGLITLWLEVVEEVACVKVFDSQKCPSLAKWREDFLEIKEIKENLPEREKLVPYFHKIRQFKLDMVAKQ